LPNGCNGQVTHGTRRKGRYAAGHDDGAVWATTEPPKDRDFQWLICAGLNEVVQLQPGETVITHTPDRLRFTPMSRKLRL